MEVALSVPANPPPTVLRRKPRIIRSRSQRQLNFLSCSLSLGSQYHRIPIACVRVSAAEHFSEPNDTVNYLKNLVHSLWDGSPKPLKEFPWGKAKDLAVKRLVFLGQKTLKWSIVVLFAFSFVSDITHAILRNKELLIPFGLFIGVALADFLKESSLDFFKSNMKDPEYIRHLIVIGCFFMSVKFIAMLFNIEGRLLLSIISNGGMMQVLWLAKGLQQRENAENQTNKHWMLAFCS